MVAKSKPGAGKAQCPYCKEWVTAGATRCPHCQADYTEADQTTMKASSKAGLIGCGALALVAVLALGLCSNPSSDTNSGSDDPLPNATYPAAQREDPAIEGLTPAQKNARRSAESYLSFKGFSRKGLIEQLSSDAGEGYEKSDATAAVDSISVDWNEQAARSAESYLSFRGFSCSGLVDQLSSSAGEGFTREQASYGAKKAGAC